MTAEPASPQTVAEAVAQARAALAAIPRPKGKGSEHLPSRELPRQALPQPEAVAQAVAALAGFRRAAAVLEAALADLAPYLTAADGGSFPEAPETEEGTSP